MTPARASLLPRTPHCHAPRRRTPLFPGPRRATGGVERVFSAAGRMHTDLRKSMQDSTLEHSILAAFNNP